MTSTVERRFENTAASQTFRNIVNTFGLNKEAVLDLGCSYGEFLVHFGKRSVGITIDPKEVEYGKNRGLDIRQGNIESGDVVSNETFDAIFCNNLFEHLYSPHGFLIRIKKYLRPGGTLILGVPCI